MNTYHYQRHRYGDWRDMTVDELRDWLHLRVTSWWRHVTLMDLYDDHQTQDASESPKTLQRTALGQFA
jgi:hypothetical protein